MDDRRSAWQKAVDEFMEEWCRKYTLEIMAALYGDPNQQKEKKGL